MKDPKVILVRLGIPNKCKYCACDHNSNPIRGFDRLGDVRKHWKKEIKLGRVQIVREMDKTPDFTTINETAEMFKQILRNYAKEKEKFSQIPR